jgi:LCP family protein required for cell wall assembly
MGQKPLYFPKLIANSLIHRQSVDQARFNLMVLGLDPRDDILEQTLTTDTIILVSLNLKKYQLTTISLPRDLWDYSLKQKINQIYPQAVKDYSPNIYPFLQGQYQRFLGQPIDRTLIVTTQNLKELIALVGGVTVYLDQGFRDSQYPHPDYINHLQGDAPVYKTVEFQSGWVHLDSNNILEFIRSRKGGQTLAEGGTDLARVHRQQIFLQALFRQICRPQFILRAGKLQRLYQIFHQSLQSNLSDSDLLNLLLRLNWHIFKITFSRIEIPVSTDSHLTPIYDPQKLYYRQWVFLPSDENYTQLRHFINSRL